MSIAVETLIWVGKLEDVTALYKFCMAGSMYWANGSLGFISFPVAM